MFPELSERLRVVPLCVDPDREAIPRAPDPRMTLERGFEQVSVQGAALPAGRSGRAGRALATVADRLLRPLPTLCGELALLVRRP